jgi:glycosyltransferase involved in cell wall biosynthesis
MYLPFAAALQSADPREFDLVWAERPHVARLLAGVRARTILDLDDVEHVRIRRHLALRRSWWPSGELLRELNRYFLYRRMELRWSRGFRATVVCSESDRLYLEGHGCRNVRVVPNGVNESGTSASEKRDGTASGARQLRVAFLGNLAHGPNLDAVTYFADEVLPLLRSSEPNCTFEVFGPVGDDARVRPYRDRVRFHGFVPDIAAVLSECDVFVAPIRYGSGTRVKLLDAMACGIPVVTTAVGAEGLDVVDGEHVLVGAGARGLADAIAAIRRDPRLGARLAGRARELVDRRYRNASIQDDVARWLAALAGVDG